jgi:hypothetical protein
MERGAVSNSSWRGSILQNSIMYKGTVVFLCPQPAIYLVEDDYCGQLRCSSPIFDPCIANSLKKNVALTDAHRRKLCYHKLCRESLSKGPSC